VAIWHSIGAEWFVVGHLFWFTQPGWGIVCYCGVVVGDSGDHGYFLENLQTSGAALAALLAVGDLCHVLELQHLGSTVTWVSFTYSIRLSGRARRVRLSIHSDGRVVVTAPRRVSQRFIDEFIRANEAWVVEKIAEAKKLQKKYSPAGTRAEFLQYREQARTLVHERLKHFNAFYNFSYQRVAIKNQSTRWGSCSKQGNLNFNYKLALLPAHLADYVIVHELCHLKEMNHSPKFWALVEQTIPDYKKRRKELRG